MQKELDMYMKKIHNIRLYAIVHGLIEKHYTAFVNNIALLLEQST